MMDIGRSVSGYRIEAHLGTGSMGEVYKVRHLSRNTLHALKFLPLPSKKVRQRLLREAELQSRLSHPNVVGLTEVIDVDGDPGLIMEFVDGPSLEQWLEMSRPSLGEVESMFRGVVLGVAHAHRKGFVHRDLKPSNVLLARTARGLVPKVADFGIAKVLDSSNPAGEHGITRTGTGLGSPAYMAPEQMRDARNVDQSADIWSLGCILYELVCGKRPFEGSDVLETMNAAQKGRFSDPRDHRPDLPERFIRAIRGCIQIDSDDRFENCEALLVALDDGSAATVNNDISRSSTPPPVPSAPPPEPVPASKGLPTSAFLLITVLIATVLALALILAITR